MSQQPIPPTNSQSINEISILNQWGKSPLPAWLFSSSLLLTPILRTPKIPISVDTPNSSFLKKNARLVSAYPSNLQVAVFSGFIGLGGFMCYDNDPKNGSAVITVWSLLYVLSTFRNSLWNLKIFPKTMTGLALTNAGLYGCKYFNIL
ncbi:hypothetical protein DAPK24_037990 [Pichia kluyveri]|uniref:Altered inheritance of mitochondria protein 19 n=1 Tax=Pichia kluyveri TaxID=36015 RepID=A0AAV5R9D5_PICKL|nr:hypothetical protein DAPK24_037990 [Pichia kluyveri]